MSATPSIEEQNHVDADASNPAGHGRTSDELDERARKRIKVGLSPRRPTAKTTTLRPPDGQRLPLPAWVLAFLLVGVLVLTSGLLALNMTDERPAWWPVLAASGRTDTALPDQASDGVIYHLRVGEDFGESTSSLPQGMTEGEWRTELLPDESVYRMEVWPNHLTWSLLGLTDLDAYRLQTSALIDAQARDGFAGVMVRYQDARHFYLLSIDGKGRYAIQRQDDDDTRVIVPWTKVPFLNPAGNANVLTVEDNGDVLRFFGNGMLLHDISEPGLSGGLCRVGGRRARHGGRCGSILTGYSFTTSGRPVPRRGSRRFSTPRSFSSHLTHTAARGSLARPTEIAYTIVCCIGSN